MNWETAQEGAKVVINYDGSEKEASNFGQD